MMTRVLVVDDDTDVQIVLARDLRGRNYEVELAGTYEEALAALTGEDPLHVLLTDLRMPCRDGLDLLAEARRISPETKSVLMSAYATAKDCQAALDLGAITVLCKPFTRTELLDAVTRAEECCSSFHGRLHGVMLMDVLQLLHARHRSVRVEVGGQTPGHILLLEGELADAGCGETRGEDALAQLLAAPSGWVETHSIIARVDRNIEGSFDAIVDRVSQRLRAEESRAEGHPR
jgi:CheY-like chemotaxis protein